MSRAFRVTAVRVEPSANETHNHVAAVRQGTNPQLIQRVAVLADLRDEAGDRYYIEEAGLRTDLVVVECPICSFPDYLRTSADGTTADRLLDLPRA